MSSNIRKLFEDAGERGKRTARLPASFATRPSLEEIKEKHPDYDPAPCSYRCGPTAAGNCERGRECTIYMQWALRYKAKSREKLEKRLRERHGLEVK